MTKTTRKPPPAVILFVIALAIATFLLFSGKFGGETAVSPPDSVVISSKVIIYSADKHNPPSNAKKSSDRHDKKSSSVADTILGEDDVKASFEEMRNRRRISLLKEKGRGNGDNSTEGTDQQGAAAAAIDGDEQNGEAENDREGDVEGRAVLDEESSGWLPFKMSPSFASSAAASVFASLLKSIPRIEHISSVVNAAGAGERGDADGIGEDASEGKGGGVEQLDSDQIMSHRNDVGAKSLPQPPEKHSSSNSAEESKVPRTPSALSGSSSVGAKSEMMAAANSGAMAETPPAAADVVVVSEGGGEVATSLSASSGDAGILDVYNVCSLEVKYPRPQDLLTGISIIGTSGAVAAISSKGHSGDASSSSAVVVADTTKLMGSLSFPLAALREGDGHEGVVLGSRIVPERLLTRDLCAAHTPFHELVTSSSSSSMAVSSSSLSSSSSGPPPPAELLSENPSTARLLSQLPVDAQRAIAQQNYYYRYLRDKVMALDTKTGMWLVQKPSSDASSDSQTPIEQREKGVISGGWLRFRRVPEAMMFNDTVSAAERAKLNALPQNTKLPADDTERLKAIKANPVFHWEDEAAAVTDWYRPEEEVGSPSAASPSPPLRYNAQLCNATRSVPFPITTPLLIERLANKRLLFLGDSMIRNTFVATIARLCNYPNSAQCMARMPTYEYDIDKADSAHKGPIGCLPKYGAKFAQRQKRKTKTENSRGGVGGEKEGIMNDGAADALAVKLEAALDDALQKMMGTDPLSLKARRLRDIKGGGGGSGDGDGEDAQRGGEGLNSEKGRGGGENFDIGAEQHEAIMKKLQEDLNKALSLSPCYRHANFFFLPIKGLTMKLMSKNPNERRQLTKGDLIPPTINVEFPLINLTLIYCSVVKPKMIHAVAKHIAFLNMGTAAEAAPIYGGDRHVMTHVPVRYFGGAKNGNGKGDAAADDAVSLSGPITRRGFDVPTFGPRHGFLSHLDGILVSIGPHLKFHDLIGSVHSYPDALAALKHITKAPIVVAEYTHVLRTNAEFAELIDKVSEAIKLRLAMLQPDPPMFIPQRFVTQFMYRLRDAGNTTVEDFNRPDNSFHVRNTVFDPISGLPLYGPNPHLLKSDKDLFDAKHFGFFAPRGSSSGGGGGGSSAMHPPYVPEADRVRHYHSSAVDAEGGGSLTGIAGCGFYDNQHPAMRCHMVLSELVLGGLLAKLAGRDATMEAVVSETLSKRQG